MLKASQTTPENIIISLHLVGLCKLLNCTPCQSHFHKFSVEFLITHRKQFLHDHLSIKSDLSSLSINVGFAKSILGFVLFYFALKHTKVPLTYCFMSVLNLWTSSKADPNFFLRSYIIRSILVTVKAIFASLVKLELGFRIECSWKSLFSSISKGWRTIFWSMFSKQFLTAFIIYPFSYMRKVVREKAVACLSSHYNIIGVGVSHYMTLEVVNSFDQPQKLFCCIYMQCIWTPLWWKHDLQKLTSWVGKGPCWFTQLVIKPCELELPLNQVYTKLLLVHLSYSHLVQPSEPALHHFANEPSAFNPGLSALRLLAPSLFPGTTLLWDFIHRVIISAVFTIKHFYSCLFSHTGFNRAQIIVWCSVGSGISVSEGLCICKRNEWSQLVSNQLNSRKHTVSS